MLFIYWNNRSICNLRSWKNDTSQPQTSEMKICDSLPDEIILKIFCFLNPRDLGNCRQVSRQFYRICHDPQLLRHAFPHICIDGTIYLKEQAYRTPKLLESILTNNKENDLDWLISRQTQAMKNILSSKTAWGLAFSVLNPIWKSIGQAAYRAASSIRQFTEIDYAIWDSIGLPNWDGYDMAVWDTVYEDAWPSVKNNTWDAARRDAWHAAYDSAVDADIKAELLDEMVKRILTKYSDNLVRLSQKSWQIYECLILLELDQSFYRKVEKITVGYRLHGMDLDINMLHPGNPWATQYHKLFGIENA